MTLTLSKGVDEGSKTLFIRFDLMSHSNYEKGGT